MPKALAILVADIHLSLQKPACRADDDWLAVQKHYLDALSAAAKREHAPIICAGDIFDRWNPSPELLVFALKYLPQMYAVPGQHDLPNHSMDHKHRSGYAVLEEAGKVMTLDPVKGEGPGGLAVFGFGWGVPISPFPLRQVSSSLIKVAVIHRYCWMTAFKYPGAPQTHRVKAYKEMLRGFDVAVFGDNHHSFTAKIGRCQVVNCGGFTRRKSDEIKNKPSYWILWNTGTVQRVPFKTNIDKFHANPVAREELDVDMSKFVEQLEEMGEHGLNFREEVKRYLDGQQKEMDPLTREIILTTLE